MNMKLLMRVLYYLMKTSQKKLNTHTANLQNNLKLTGQKFFLIMRAL